VSCSFQWGKEKSEKWLSAVLLSFIEDILLLEPLKVNKVTWHDVMFSLNFISNESIRNCMFLFVNEEGRLQIRSNIFVEKRIGKVIRYLNPLEKTIKWHISTLSSKYPTWATGSDGKET